MGTERSSTDLETEFWLSVPGTLDDVAEAREDVALGRTAGAADLRAEFGLPPRTG